MALKDLRKTLDATHKLPIGNKIYEVKPISADVGLRFQGLTEVVARSAKSAQDNIEYSPTKEDEILLDDVAELDLFRDALGETWIEMTDDGVSFEELKMCALYVIFHAVMSPEHAEEFWNSGGKAPARNRAERRMATRTRTGAATTTQKRASRTGTTTRKGTTKPAA